MLGVQSIRKQLYTTEWWAIPIKGGRGLHGVYVGGLSPKEVQRRLSETYTGSDAVKVDRTEIHLGTYVLDAETFIAYATKLAN